MCTESARSDLWGSFPASLLLLSAVQRPELHNVPSDMNHTVWNSSPKQRWAPPGNIHWGLWRLWTFIPNTSTHHHPVLWSSTTLFEGVTWIKMSCVFQVFFAYFVLSPPAGQMSGSVYLSGFVRHSADKLGLQHFSKKKTTPQCDSTSLLLTR